MTEIINWNDLWKLKILSSPLRKTLEEDAGSLGDKYAKRCSEFSLQNKENTGKEIAKIELNPEYTVLDIGSGPGRLAIPISKKVKAVTAIDPSKDILAYLQQNMGKEDVRNITCIQKQWEDIELGVDVEPHDVVIAADSLGMLDIQEAVAKIDAASKGCVYLLTSAGRGTDEAIWKETYNERYSAWPNYIYLYNILHDMGIYANVEIWNSEFEQRYNSLDDAVNEWKEIYSIPSEKESILRGLLSRMLVEDDGTLCLKHKYKRAMIWWRKE